MWRCYGRARCNAPGIAQVGQLQGVARSSAEVPSPDRFRARHFLYAMHVAGCFDGHIVDAYSRIAVELR